MLACIRIDSLFPSRTHEKISSIPPCCSLYFVNLIYNFWKTDFAFKVMIKLVHFGGSSQIPPTLLSALQSSYLKM